MKLNCRDFERLMNEQLDAREAAPLDALRDLAGHRAVCPACRSVAFRYETLSQAITAMSLHPPLPPADFAARFPEDWQTRVLPFDEASKRTNPALRPVFGLIAAAAVLLLAVWQGVRPAWRPPPGRPAAPPLRARPIDPDALSNALAEATSATWDLARATSAPAARVGREVLDAAAQTETTAALSLPDGVGSTEDVLQDFGQRVNEGVAPLSGTARHAFGFLIGTSGG